MQSVLVIMSTYNGEKYLREQLDSILKQEEVEINILIRDDGSKDSTIPILKEYEKEYDNIEVIYAANVGVMRSFMELLYVAPNYDYYSFADQDDIWLPKKTISAIRMLKCNSKPELCYSWSTIVDSNLNVLNDSREYELPKNKIDSLTKAWAPGNTIVFNFETMKLVRKYKISEPCAHDMWLYILCTYFGNVYLDKRSFILYRKHGENVTGGNDVGNKGEWKELLRVQIKKWNKNSLYINYGKFLYEGYKQLLTTKDRNELRNFAFYKKSIRCKINLLLNTKIKRRTLRGTVSIKLAILCSRF